MNTNAIFGIISITSFLLPVVVILYNRLYKKRSLTALLIIYTLDALYNMMLLKIIPSTSGFRQNFNILDNYLDIPLLMVALLFFCPNKQNQKKVYLLTTSFAFYELVITCFFGFSSKSVVYILGPGIPIIWIFSLFLFTRQIKFAISHGKNSGRTLMLASILFAYSCYGLIYYFFYIQKTNFTEVQKTKFTEDTYIIYFISSSVSCLIMSIGLIFANKRLKKLNDLKVTRRELQIFFNT